MQLVTIDGVAQATIAAAVGAPTYARGMRYAREHAVRHMTWDDAQNALCALVLGSAGNQYRTTVYFRSTARGGLAFEFGECSCPMEVDCKHAAAVAIVATAPIASPASPGPAAPPRSPSWERSLGELLMPARSAAPRSSTVPLAVELSLVPGPAVGARPGSAAAQPRLLARLLRPGRTGWVVGSVSWSKVESGYQLTDCHQAHLELLRELYLTHQTRSASPGYHYYSSAEVKTIDLAGLGARIWPLLDEAAELGIEIVHAQRGLGPVARYRNAAVVLDITAGGSAGARRIEPSLRAIEGPELGRPVMFLGADGHGVVCVPRDQAGTSPAGWRLELARLDTPAPPALQQLILQGQQLEVPAEQQARFAERYYPRLRQLARIESSDASFVPPAISGPTLVLQADYRAAHELALRWSWAYQVGETRLRAPLDGDAGPEQAFRDPAAERRVLDSLDLPQLTPTAQLDGLETMRFSTEVLPLLADAPGVTVELTGEPADYREAGDSLQISVSTGDVPGERDWFDLGVDLTVEGQTVPFGPVFAALARGESYLLLPSGAYFSLHKPELQRLRTLIEEARALQDGPPGTLRISRFQAGLWDELAALGVVERQASAWRQQVGGLLAVDGPDTTPPPPALRATLRPYQLEGFRWLWMLYRHRLGGILADDMGLGKTVQTLAMICQAVQQEEGRRAPFLIVAPTSVVANWAAEAARFAPELAVVTITDTLRRRGQELAEAVAGADVVVTTYTLFRLDIDAHAAADWSGLIMDEAQFAKNHQSKVYQCARRLPAPFKLAITGTPLENNLMELWSMLSITAPGLFPHPSRFREHYARPIENSADAELLARLRRRIKPLVRRRTKEQVAADLPEKQVQLLEVELDTRHRRIYQRHLQRERQKVLGLLDDVDRNRFTILRSLTLLRQLSLHPGLVDPEHRELSCSKIEALVAQLAEVVDGGHRALVFSQFTGFLAQVRERLDAAGVAYAYLDGRTRNRPAVVQRFKEGTAPVFLISLKAGGFGLNLTEADYCFLLDPWWNPAAEAQAVDRTHRIGQLRNVMVYRMIAKDTIEEKVLALASRKAQLFTSVLDEGGVFSSALDAADIRELIA